MTSTGNEKAVAAEFARCPPVEIVSLKDLERIPELLAAFALSLKKGGQFKVKI